MCDDDMAILKLHPKLGVRQRLNDFSVSLITSFWLAINYPIILSQFLNNVKGFYGKF